MSLIIAVDPGAHGAIAWRDGDDRVLVDPMPETERDIWDWFFEIRWIDGLIRHDVSVAMERVGMHRAGNAASTSVKFGTHVGGLRMACIGNDISLDPPEGILPQAWMKSVCPGLPAGQENYQARKRAIRDAMQKLYPHLKVTLQNADALGLLTFVLRKKGVA